VPYDQCVAAEAVFLLLRVANHFGKAFFSFLFIYILLTVCIFDVSTSS
jgi:hypothetical protein